MLDPVGIYGSLQVCCAPARGRRWGAHLAPPACLHRLQRISQHCGSAARAAGLRRERVPQPVTQPPDSLESCVPLQALGAELRAVCACLPSIAACRGAFDAFGGAQHARDCMRLARRTARDYLNFGDGSLPNCLRMSFHDAATYVNTTDKGGCAGTRARPPRRLTRRPCSCAGHRRSPCGQRQASCRQAACWPALERPAMQRMRQP